MSTHVVLTPSQLTALAHLAESFDLPGKRDLRDAVAGLRSDAFEIRVRDPHRRIAQAIDCLRGLEL